ncbi:hypothetical protein HPB52_000995 [Rhipicephalus sanguineus]|uniref:Uncharacterized protein n=1 Tax=Rhipicephalus sanguineus TaxID=34632 RepID=A0A9D4QG61_RHISA|nr:hypothetical protein HPB52_000995 [Rhipicephalus sanguineus]
MLRDAAAPTGAPGDSKWKGERTIRQIANASRLPRIPAEDYKVIVRPREELNVSEHRQARMYCCLRNAAGTKKYAEDAAWPPRRKNTSVKQDVSYAGKVTLRETDAARQNTRHFIWPGEGAGSDEEEKKRRPKRHTVSTTTTNELAKQRARTPRDQKAN